MKLIPITKETGSAIFHDVGRVIYQDDPNWIAPLDMEVENIFNPAKNSCFADGEAERWVLEDDQGQLIGRIAAFVDYKKARKSDPQAGGVGFFECIDDQVAANLLFDTGRDWLKERGMQAMDGSINFGENFSYWGVLFEGFMKQGYGMPYNKSYYQKLFENYGFKDYFQQFSYHIDLSKTWPERMIKFAEFLASRPGYSYRHYRKRQSAKYIADLVEIFNTTWEDYMEGFEPMTVKDLESVIESAKPVIIEDFIWFAYKDDKPIAMVVTFPDINQVLAKFDGRMSFWKLLRFLWLKSGKTITRNRVLLAGVVPEHQNSGVIAALFLQFAKATKKRTWYNEIELSWVGDYNPRMRKVYEQIGATQAKKHVTYRYMIDPSVPFSRFTNDGGNSTLRREAIKKES